jgi:branched-chain amino acid transport system substrate-binding protein
MSKVQPKKNQKKFWYVIGIALLILTLISAFGCGSKEEATPGEEAGEKVLKLGVIGPFTGPVAATGEEFKGAVTLAFEKINYQIGDYKVEIVWIDSQSDPEKACKAYEEAVLKNGVQATIGNWHSSVAIALMDLSAKYQVPHFFGISLAKSIIEKYQTDPEKYSYWLKGWPIPDKQYGTYFIALEEAIAEGWTPRTKIAAIYAEDTDLGRNVATIFNEELKSRGWEVASENFVKVGETDFYPMLTKVRDQDISILAGTATSGPSAAAMIKQAREVGLKALIIADGLGWTGEWYNLGGKATDYVLDMQPSWLTDESKAFRDEFEQRFKFIPSPSAAGVMYDSSEFFIELAEEALNQHGEITKESLYNTAQDKIKNGTMSHKGTVNVEYKYTPESLPDPLVGEQYFMTPVVQYFDGKPKIVWPSAFREGPIEIPDFAK